MPRGLLRDWRGARRVAGRWRAQGAGDIHYVHRPDDRQRPRGTAGHVARAVPRVAVHLLGHHGHRRRRTRRTARLHPAAGCGTAPSWPAPTGARRLPQRAGLALGTGDGVRLRRHVRDFHLHRAHPHAGIRLRGVRDPVDARPVWRRAVRRKPRRRPGRRREPRPDPAGPPGHAHGRPRRVRARRRQRLGGRRSSLPARRGRVRLRARDADEGAAVREHGAHPGLRRQHLRFQRRQRGRGMARRADHHRRTRLPRTHRRRRNARRHRRRRHGHRRRHRPPEQDRPASSADVPPTGRCAPSWWNPVRVC